MHAVDPKTNAAINGTVVVDDVQIGETNKPFNHLFNTHSPTVKGKVVPIDIGYSEKEFDFFISLPSLKVRANPNTIELGKVNEITIYATDLITNQNVPDGFVTSNEGPTPAVRRIGPTQWNRYQEPCQKPHITFYVEKSMWEVSLGSFF